MAILGPACVLPLKRSVFLGVFSLFEVVIRENGLLRDPQLRLLTYAPLELF
jgi:hypothetical protein